MPQIIPLFKRIGQKLSIKKEEEKKEQFFIFKFGTKAFSIPAIDVTEVSKMLTIVPQQGKTEYLDGIINVRGSIVPLVNIRKRIDMPEKYSVTDNSKIILFTIKTGFYVGMIVDDIEFNLKEGTLEPLPETMNNEKVFGYANIDNEKYPVFLIDKWLEPSEFEFMQKVSAEF